ncbi:MAG: DMT family transporter [Fibrobacter sp.]|nr:DMT family transporter [Fibrobacter sp.]
MKKLVLSEGASVFSAILFSIMAVLVKLSTGHLNGIQISFFRFLIGGLLSIGAILLFRQKIRPYGWLPVMARAILGSISMIIFYQAIGLSSGGRATLLNNLYPFFVAIFGGLFFRDKISLIQIFFMLLSFTGTILIFYDGSKYPLAANILAVSSALIVGLSVNFMKLARENNSALMLYFWICLFGTIFSAPSIIWSDNVLKNIDIKEWLLVIVNAVVVFGAQFLFTWGQKYLSAVRNSFIQFMKIPFTLVLSIFFLDEVMTRRFWIGCTMVTAGLLIDTLSAWQMYRIKKT